jgi:hypothetical protein
VLLLVLAAGAALVGLRSWSEDRPTAPPNAATSTPEPGVVLRTVPPPDPPCSGCPTARFRLTAREGHGPDGVRLVTSGRRPAVLDLRTGRTAPLRGLPLARGQAAQATRVAGGLVAVVATTEGSLVGAYLLRDSGQTVRLGRFDVAVPGQDGGFLAYDAGYERPVPGRLVSFGPEGGIRWQRSIPSAMEIVRDTPYGLLVHQMADSTAAGGPLRLVDPRTGAVRRTLGSAMPVLASTDRLVAWLPGWCDQEGSCPVRVTDLRTRRTAEYAPPLRRTPGTAAFSPRGQLAVGVGGLHDFVPGSGPDSVRDGFVALLDPASGRFRRLPGLSTQAKHTPALGWSPDGEWLLMAVQPDDRHDRLVMWRRGQHGLTVLPAVLPAGTLGSWQGLVVLH